MKSKANEPDDNVVKRAILFTLNNSVSNLRPNKLRKIICKQLSETNWTQYARVLDNLIGDGAVKTTEIDGEQFLLVSGNCSSENVKKEASCREKEKDGSTSTIYKMHKMEIPRAVLYHLTKKAHSKQRNIETNTKTKISFASDAIHPYRGGIDRSKNNLKDLVMLTITNDKSIETKGLVAAKDSISEEETSEKQVKTAVLMIEKMVKAYEKNPERFGPKRAGGTLAEQEEARKRKQEVSAKFSNKAKSVQRVGDGNDRNDGETKKSLPRSVEKREKKKRRKFY